MSKNVFIPIIIIALLTSLYFTRWDRETSFKPFETIQLSYKTDRWTGDRWLTIYSSERIDVIEVPAVEDLAQRASIEWWRKALTYTWHVLFWSSVIWLIYALNYKKTENTYSQGAGGLQKKWKFWKSK